MVMNWKGFGRSRRGLILTYYPSIRLELLRKTTKNSIRIACRRGRYLYLGPPECESGVLTTRPRRSVVGFELGSIIHTCDNNSCVQFFLQIYLVSKKNVWSYTSTPSHFKWRGAYLNTRDNFTVVICFFLILYHHLFHDIKSSTMSNVHLTLQFL
jgi:hypothetical protein